MSQNNLPIYVVGAGAIGVALAVFLKRKGLPVVLIKSNTTERFQYEKVFSVHTKEHRIYSERLVVKSINLLDNCKGVFLLCNKSFANKTIAKRLTQLGNDFPIVLVQNGLNIEIPFVELGFQQIYRTVLFATSQYIETDIVRYKLIKPSPAGIIKGSEEFLYQILTKINTDEFPFEYASDIHQFIWTKTILNTAFNSICPLLETDNGIFQRDEAVRDLAKRIIEIGIQIADLEGVKLNKEVLIEGLLSISKFSEGQLISTYQDILKKRPTEIDTLNFELVRVANRHGFTNKLETIELLGKLIQIKSRIT